MYVTREREDELVKLVKDIIFYAFFAGMFFIFTMVDLVHIYKHGANISSIGIAILMAVMVIAEVTMIVRCWHQFHIILGTDDHKEEK